MTASAVEFMSAAPKGVSGNTPWAARYAAEVRRIWLAHAAQDARTLQTHLGPSELGVECDRQVAWKLLGIPATNHVVDPWPSIRGRALHTMAEDVLRSANERTGLMRWVPEQKVTGHPEHPGTADAYDAVEQCVVDHKFLGESSMAKIRKDPPRKYKGQLFLYGLGYLILGLPVRKVVVAAYPATAGSLDGLYIWEHPFADESGELDPAVATLLDEIFVQTAERKELAQAVRDGVISANDVKPTPSSDECYFCDFYRPQAAKDGGTGCAGTKVEPALEAVLSPDSGPVRASAHAGPVAARPA